MCWHFRELPSPTTWIDTGNGRWRSDLLTWTYPAPFIEDAIFHASPRDTRVAQRAAWIPMSLGSATTGQYYFAATSLETREIGAQLFAIGRWK